MSRNSQPDVQRPDSSRRAFIGSCTAGMAMAVATGSARAASQAPVRRFAPVDLVDDRGQKLRCDQLEVNREYIFHYPFKSTPCFLINLGKPVPGGERLQRADGSAYEWKGGTGANRSVVAFSAICTHKLTHPSPVVSFIGYREEPVGFYNRNTNEVEQRAGIIQCCSEQSIYDPAHGAQVMAGPAPQPLAAIELEEHDGCLRATGVYGVDQFERYFETFADRLGLQYKGDSYREAVSKSAVVVPGDVFSRNRITCG